MRHLLSPLLCALLGCSTPLPPRQASPPPEPGGPGWDSGDTGGPASDGAAPGQVGPDEDGDGTSRWSGDCDDTNPTVHPGAAELCDGLDNDCDGEVDETCHWQAMAPEAASWQAHDATGWRVAAGDTNGNRRDGVLLSDETADGGRGEVRLYDRAGTPEATLLGTEGLGLGRSLALVGDVNGDTHPDLFATTAHAAVVLLQGPFVGTETPDPTAAGIHLDTAPLAAVASPADEDGVVDLLVTVPGAAGSAVHLWPGPFEGWFETADAAASFDAPAAAAGFGEAVVTGDLDGDGFLDVIIAAPRDATSGAATGAVAIWQGPVSGSQPLYGATTILRSRRSLDAAGTALEVCDLDGDGRLELLVGRPGVAAGGVHDAGDVVAIPWRESLPGTLDDAAAAGVLGSSTTGGLGISVACADLDGDEVLDLAIGHLRPGGYDGDDEGAVDVVAGPVEGRVLAPTLRVRGGDPRMDFGRAIAVLDGGEGLLVGGRHAFPTVLEAAVLLP